MFHMKLFNLIKNRQIHELFFYFFVLSIPLQLRIIFNSDKAYIDYVFSYQKAIFIYLSDILFLCFIIPWFVSRKEKIYGWKFLVLPILWSIFNVFHVKQYDLWLYGTVKIAEFWLIVLYIKNNSQVRDNALKLLIFSGLFQSFIGIYQFYSGHALGLRFIGEYLPNFADSGAARIAYGSVVKLRAYGTMPHPNVFGGFLALSLGILLYVSRETKSFKDRIIVSGGTFILLWGLLVSFSRSAWIAIALSVLTFLVWLVAKKQLKLAIFWIFLVIVSCGTLAYFNRNYVFPRATDVGVNSQASTYRQEFNQLGFNLAKQHILNGVGTNQYIPTLQNTVEFEPWEYQPPHNVLLLILVEQGLIGLFIWIYAAFELCFTWNKFQLFSIMTVTTLFVLMMFDHYLITIQQGILTFGLILGLFSTKKDVSQGRETS